MTPQQIKRAKRLAEILEITTHDITDHCGDADALVGDSGEWFFPEQDKALLWDLQIKCEVVIDPWKDGTGVVYIESKEFTREWSVDFDDVADIPAALIDCVIEINGGYDV